VVKLLWGHSLHLLHLCRRAACAPTSATCTSSSYPVVSLLLLLLLLLLASALAIARLFVWRIVIIICC
jgi:hypothetical protein